jgi:diguanylate cyclase (GGDEF)-like protein
MPTHPTTTPDPALQAGHPTPIPPCGVRINPGGRHTSDRYGRQPPPQPQQDAHEKPRLRLFDLQARLIAAQRVTDLHAELDRHRAQLAHLARHDPLTGLSNRRALDEDLEVLHARSQRYGRGFALAMCDIDRFKAYNDTHGHQAGDQALRAVAATIVGEVRGGDGVYRYGGEEFLLVLPEQTLDTARVAVERVRSAVERLAIPQPAAGPGGRLTLSAGIAAFSPGEPTTAEELLGQADAALYRAKSAGRNRLALADSQPS